MRLTLGAVAAGAALAVGLAHAAPASESRLPQLHSAKSGGPDFSYAGYRFGLAPLPDTQGTVIEATAHGVIPDDGKDDAKALLRAIAAADVIDGKVTVQLPKGRIQIGEVIPLERSNFVLRGAGSGAEGTELYFPRPLKIVDDPARQEELRGYLKHENKYEVIPDQNINFLFSEYSWSGGFLLVGPKADRPVSYDPARDRRTPVLADPVSGQQFGQMIRVKDASRLSVGQVVQVQWYSVDGADSAILRSMYGDLSAWNGSAAGAAAPLTIGSHHWTFVNRPVVAQPTRITAIRGNTVTIGDPLLHGISAGQPAVLAAWEHLEEVGIEAMKLTFPDNPWYGHHLEAGFNGIYLTGLFDGWVRDVEIRNADSGILTDNAGSLTIDAVRTAGEHKAHYTVHVGAVHNVLVRDLVVENPAVHPVSVNTRSTRSVFLRADVRRDAIIDQHSGSNHQNLFDQLTMHVAPRSTADGWTWRLWRGGGAPYWKPGHGLFNTHWNIRLVFPDSVPEKAEVTITSGLEGPGARIVGLHGNRRVTLDYRPTPHVEMLNAAVASAPSLYEYQLRRRRAPRR
ncbi:hypothetical protein [Porphyrobacter sp. YT40]|uniref:hypothetical protein n=1 Tax=Porphyrobacter sp. YT40 TaxID=2547601 RepID=UPI001143A49C|nr:hypothetical protein [Porphyrobacter sp. YT40]QDH33229.1 hypothetical protein E2E27_02075 [Porphyrobacter sp. YT40]